MKVENLYSEKQLFERVSESDEQAFRMVFDRYWPQVYGTTLHLTKQAELARDLSQDIFIRLWENRGLLSEVVHPSSYLYTLSRNLVIDHLRRKVFDPSNTEFLLSYFQSGIATPQEKAEFRELDELLKKAIDTLHGKVKDVFLLSRYEGLTHEQIAARLGISIVSSKTYVVRALQQIRKFMETHSDSHLLLMAIALLMRQ